MRVLAFLLVVATGVIVISGCAKQVKTVTRTKTITTAAKPEIVTVQAPAPKPKVITRTRTVAAPPPPQAKPKANPPPAGVFQVGDKRFLVRPGFEANMHHLCDGKYDDGESKTANYVNHLEAINGDFLVECVGTVGKRYLDLPFTPTPQASPGLAGRIATPSVGRMRRGRHK